MTAAIAVFLMAFVPRAVYLLWASPPFLGEYWQLSTGLLQQGTFTIDGVSTARLEPLYPMCLAAARALTSDRVIAVQALQVAVASAGAVWLFLSAGALTRNRGIAWTAALLYAFDPLLVRHAADSSDSALVTMLLILFVYLFARGRTALDAAAAGTVLGLAILTRAMTLPLVLLAGIACARQRGAAHGLALAAAALALAAPMLARDRAHGALLPSRTGVNLFIANSRYTAALLPAYSPDLLQEYAYDAAARSMTGGNDASKDSVGFRDRADPVLERLAWASMREHPIRTLVLKLRNVLYFFSPGLIPSHMVTPESSALLGTDSQVSVTGAPLRPPGERLLYLVSSLFVLMTAAVGIYVRRNNLANEVVLWAVLLTFVVVYSLYFPATRYAAPVRFIFLFYAAAAIDFLRSPRRQFAG